MAKPCSQTLFVYSKVRLAPGAAHLSHGDPQDATWYQVAVYMGTFQDASQVVVS